MRLAVPLMLLILLVTVPCAALAQETPPDAVGQPVNQDDTPTVSSDPADQLVTQNTGVDQDTTVVASPDPVNQPAVQDAEVDQGNTSTASPWGDTIEPVPPGEFVDKVTNLIVSIRDGMGKILEPLSGLSLMACAVLLVLGVFLGGIVRRIALGGVVLVVAGLMIYWFGPLILGVIASIAGSL